MNTENQDIKSFFEDMRKEDSKHTIPEFEEVFPEKKTSKLRYLLPIGIAASLLLGFGVWTKNPKTTEQEEALVITIENQESTTETLLLEDPSVFSWESSTASLINDFND
ncbi:hypothetical protein GCM10011344_14900 [Dokdonia pacifica]|uniref:Uncharacterized protein n=1 Tax=Dokdonia pacifica TaxID=1627892 RepID=A0A238W3H0_9FLAO|nr:hypothetical protein [Dokdonia pacifica]GGG15316.1 hypothetical protein GCM10011344_14900 [Dokdonia pacifica]SNR41048.1 hypothetical protein SAMN06265376_101653 [Dokdonia pacifica]